MWFSAVEAIQRWARPTTKSPQNLLVGDNRPFHEVRKQSFRNAVPAQLVDATPSHRNDFLKVVFMAQGKRNRLSAEHRVDMWCRWNAGESLHEIVRAFGKGHGSSRFLLTQRGGIVPAVRRRSPRTLTPAAREDILRRNASRLFLLEIARVMYRADCT